MLQVSRRKYRKDEQSHSGKVDVSVMTAEIAAVNDRRNFQCTNTLDKFEISSGGVMM